MNFDSMEDEGPPPPTEPFPSPGWALLITFAASVTAVTIASAVAELFSTTPNVGHLGVGLVMGFGMVGALASQRIPAPHIERIGLRGFDRQFTPLLFALLPMVFLSSELDNILRDLLPLPPDQLGPEAMETLELTPSEIVQRVIVIFGLAPVMDEWLFRGLILQGLITTVGRAPALMLSAFLFAIGSLIPAATSADVLSYFLIAFLHGLVFGIVRVATQSLFAAMLINAGFSAMSLAAFFLSDLLPIPGFNVANSHSSWTLLAPSAVLVGWSLMQLLRAFEGVPVSIPIPDLDDQAGDRGSREPHD